MGVSCGKREYAKGILRILTLSLLRYAPRPPIRGAGAYCMQFPTPGREGCGIETLSQL